MINRFIFPLMLVFMLGFVYYFSTITIPFVIAAVLAYVFQPFVGQLEKLYLHRWAGSLIVTATILTVIAVFVVYTGPILYTQLTKLILKVPAYIRELQVLLQQFFDTVSHRIPPEYTTQLQNSIQAVSKDLVTWLFIQTQSAFQGGLTLIHYLSVILLVPVITFYLMKDWTRLLKTVDYYIPPQNKKVVINQARQIDKTLASFARGQALVCLLLAMYYGVTLHVLGVEFGSLVGTLTGVFAFIPYVGAILGFLASMLIAIFQSSAWLFGDAGSVSLFIAVLIVFGVGQFLEGVILSPNIVGHNINLHPLWIMFALFLGGYMFGFAGVLVATPLAGAIGVLVRYAFNRYRDKMHYLYYGKGKRKSHGSDAQA